MFKQSFRDWYFESCVIYGQLVTPVTAALILGISFQHLNKVKFVKFIMKTSLMWVCMMF